MSQVFVGGLKEGTERREKEERRNILDNLWSRRKNQNSIERRGGKMIRLIQGKDLHDILGEDKIK
jgi:hypothetical protein